MSTPPVPSSDLTNKQGEHPRGTRTFTGCWTCRRRRVKCDERRPVCKRCELGDFRCDGYAVKLTWPKQSSTTKENTDTEDTVTSSKRSSIRHNESFLPIATDDNTAVRKNLHDVKSDGDSFSVFSLDDLTHDDRKSAPPLRVQNLMQSSVDDGLKSTSKSQKQTPTFVTYRPKRTKHVSSVPEVEGKDERESTSSLIRGSTNTGTGHRSHASDSFSSDLDVIIRDHSPMVRRPLAQTDLFSCQSELLQHWLEFIRVPASPTDGLAYESQRLFVQTAQLAESEMAKLDSSTSALVHANYGLAAASLSFIKDDRDKYQNIASRHHHASLIRIRENISDHQAKPDFDDLLLGVIMLILNLDRYIGVTGGWQAHVVGGINYILSSIAHDQIDRLDSASVNFWLLTLATSNLGKHFDIVQLRNIWQLKPWNAYFKHICFVEPWLFEVLLEAQTAAIFDHATAEALSRRIQQQVTVIESGINLEPSTKTDRLRHTISFGWSVLIYIRRTIQRVDPSLIQDVVQRVSDNLERLSLPIELIQLEPQIWAYLAAGMECLDEETQRRYLSLASDRSAFSSPAFEKSVQTLRMFWAARNEQQLGPMVVWHEFMKQMQRSATELH